MKGLFDLTVTLTASATDSCYAGRPDVEVVVHAQAGDQEAGEHLLSKYRSLVRSRVKSYFLMGAEREDLLQVGMIGLWQAIVEFNPGKAASFPAFAKVCITRNIISAINAASRQKQIPLNTALSFEVPADEENNDWDLTDILRSEGGWDPEELVIQRERIQARDRLLQQVLSGFEWSVLTEYQLGKSYQEIAEELACNPKSVDNALARIKRKVSLVTDDNPELLLDA
jgi:RNA polymerase sporulation-specific sigma factor